MSTTTEAERGEATFVPITAAFSRCPPITVDNLSAAIRRPAPTASREVARQGEDPAAGMRFRTKENGATPLVTDAEFDAQVSNLDPGHRHLLFYRA